MKTMIVADFTVMKSTLAQLAGICVAVALIMGVVMDTMAGAVAAIAAMTPFMFLFSLCAYDEQNGWERFRLTLPLSRRQVAFGRYATMAVLCAAVALFSLVVGFLVVAVASWASEGLGLSVPPGLTWAESSAAAMTASALASIAVILAACAVALPLLMRFGMTRATRFVPLVVVLALALGVGLFSDHMPDSGAVFGFLQWLEAGDGTNLVLFAGGCLVAALALFVASAPLAAKFYEQREL